VLNYFVITILDEDLPTSCEEYEVIDIKSFWRVCSNDRFRFDQLEPIFFQVKAVICDALGASFVVPMTREELNR
jgi:hypothetical protein